MLSRFGLDVLGSTPKVAKAWGRCGLICNQASVDSCLRSSWSVVKAAIGNQLVALFGPQHGFESTVQDNMIESTHGRHLPTGLPVYSLYSDTRIPTAAMLADLDTVIFDLQITGCRIYTYKATLHGLLRAAHKYGKRVVVLDRPNPMGGIYVEGRVAEKNMLSFVAPIPMPMRHGLTPGECALVMNHDVGAELEVIRMEGWDPASVWTENGTSGRPWLITSPNIPSVGSVFPYVGTVILEGTNVSEGRGTGLPFQYVGAPYLQAEDFTERVRALCGENSGFHLRPASFMPTSQKWINETCQGLHILTLKPERCKPFRLGLAIVRAALELGGSAFAWKSPPYEYEYKKSPIDVIFGADGANQRLAAPSFQITDPYWHDGLDAWRQKVQGDLLYPRQMQAQV